MSGTAPAGQTVPAFPVAPPLPPQPAGVSWPTLTWATDLAPQPDRLDDLIDSAFAHNPNPTLAQTDACVVVHRGRIVAERYGSGFNASTRVLSWSTAKSITQLALGVAVERGLIDPMAVPVHPHWADPADPRHDITLQQLLQMRDGLDFEENYTDATTSDCLEMLWGTGADDVAGYAASRPVHSPAGERFNYSSGSTNIVVAALQRALGFDADAMSDFLAEKVLGPIGVVDPELRFDAAGTWVGSSYLYLRPRDFARVGLLALRGGVWDGDRLVPEGWIDRARTAVSYDAEDGLFYGEGWWVYDDPWGTFGAKGFEGQAVLVSPGLDLVIARFGKTPIEHWTALESWYRDVIDCFAPSEETP